MPDGSLIPILLVILLGVGFDFVNGWTDAPNAIATVVSTRVLSPRLAVLMAAFFNIVGALSGTAVAETIGKGIVAPGAVTLVTVASALTSAILYSTVAWYFGLPTSESHELIAGLSGAALASAGFEALLWEGWEKVLLGLLLSTFAGFSVGLLVMVALLWGFRHTAPASVGGIFRGLQLLSAAFMAFSHGSNDAQKTMGALTLALTIQYGLSEFHVPLWVILLSALTMGLGTAFGGWRIIRTIGFKLTRLHPIHGFAAEASAASIIELASRLGIPLSTTHVIGTAIMGVGASRRFSAVRWGVAGNIVAAWVLTFPVCGAIAWALTKALHLFL